MFLIRVLGERGRTRGGYVATLPDLCHQPVGKKGARGKRGRVLGEGGRRLGKGGRVLGGSGEGC